MVAPPLKNYKVSIVLFHKDGVANASAKTIISHFSMFVTTNNTIKLDNGITGNAQVSGIILCLFTNCYIIYPVGTVYYFPGHPYNTISSVALKFYVGFQKVTSEPLEHCDFFYPQGLSWV